MKKSELKDYIKEQITNILTEATPEDVQNQADLNKELEKTADLKKSMGMNEDEEEAPAGDEKMQAKASRQDAKIQAYKDITAKMKDTLEKYKAAEGDAKEAAKEELKALTPEFQAAKKEYEKLKGVKL